MTATTQFGAGPAVIAAADWTLLPKRDIPVPQADGRAISSAGTRTHMVWAIFVIGLGAMLTLAWLIFLVWGAVTVVMLVS